MYDKPETPQQWSVHAEVTISHNPPNEGSNVPAAPPGVTHTEQSGNGLRMVYTWTSHPPSNESDYNVRSSAPSTSAFQSDTASNKSSTPGIQRGGLVFTSVPPRQTNPYDPNRLGISVQDSGYNSELLSPSSCAPSSLPRRPIIPYNRRCRSTCSIILSTAINSDGHNLKCDTTATTQPAYHQCGRTQSLRCQTPSIKPERRDSYFGCGDPWCYHADEYSNRRCSPVLESCEECSISNQSGSSRRASRANTFTTHFCTRVPERGRSSPPSFLDYRNKDMACQTVETKEKCTSPFEKIDLRPFEKKEESDSSKKKTVRKVSDRRKSSLFSSRRNSDNQVLSPPNPDSADSKKSSKRITRSPAVLRGRSPLLDKISPSRDTTKKQRTVHIDVYCTGSDSHSETDSSSDSEEGTQSSPQTVFESDQMRLSHRRADNEEMPYSIRKFLKENMSGGTVQDEQRRKLAAKLPQGQKRNSDSDDEASTAYPSALSSYSHIKDFESSTSSVPPSWSAMSTSSCTVPDGYESLANTSCKDTVSDFENLVMKKFNLVPDESEYFIPRKLQSADASSDMLSRTSAGSILPSDSFEYEDSADRDRIKKMERMWIGEPEQKTWKSPSAERKFLLQQQKMKEYMEKRVKEKSKSKKESESESNEDDSEQGWSFVRNPEDSKGAVKREITVRRASKDAAEEPEQDKKSAKNEPTVSKNSATASASKIASTPGNVKLVPNVTNINKNPPLATQISKSDDKSASLGVQPSASCTAIGFPHFKSNFRTPFTIVPGRYSDPLYTAQKFGTVIGAIRKPGHHVGPAKNPDCACDHCRQYYEDVKVRNRTRSMGDNSDVPINWREILKPRPVPPTSKLVSDF